MKRRKQRTRIALLIVLLLALVALNGLFLFLEYTWTPAGFQKRDSRFLDLRGKTLSVEDYQQLAQQLPDCDILWDVPFQGNSVSSDATALTVSSFSEADGNLLSLLPALKELDARGCRDYAALEAFGSSHPDVAVRYTVAIAGEEYPNDAESITTKDAPVSDLTENLRWLPQLTDVELTGSLPNAAQMQELRAAFPKLTFRYTLNVAGSRVESSARRLDLSGKTLNYEEIYENIGLLPDLKAVDLTGSSLSDEEIMTLVYAFPACRFQWGVTVAGLTFSSDASEIDISGQTVEDAAEVEAKLPCFANLERVIMCGCGLDDETMDALNRKYEDIRFVWTVRIKNVDVRTDTKWFYPFKYYREMVVNNDDIYPLRYCTDIEAIDIGHMTTVTDCEWVRFMPNLKYLIIVETAITDISPIASLKNLVFLEIFTTKITDYSPLVECTALEDLNLGNTYGDEEPILQMTWLKNLWWSGIEGSYGLPCSDAPAKLRATLTNTNMRFNLETPNVDNGWRQLDNYYAMRDLMDVFYLT